MVSRVGKVSLVIAIVAWNIVAIPAYFLCLPAAFSANTQQSPLCPLIGLVSEYLLPISGIFGMLFMIDLIFDTSEEQERKTREQIEFEKEWEVRPTCEDNQNRS